MEVGRAIGVGVFGGVGVGHEMVDPVCQKVVGDIFHVSDPLRPAEGTEDLRHDTVFHVGIDMRQRRRQLAEHVIEEMGIGVFPADVGGLPQVGVIGNHLMEHDIDARHVLPPQSTEEMARTVAQTLVGVVVLDDMTDVQNLPLTAPIAQQGAEIFIVALGDDLHIGGTDGGTQLGQSMPQSGQIFHRIAFGASHLGGDLGDQIRVPGHLQILGAHGLMITSLPVGKGRLIGEKAAEGIAEIVLEMGVGGLVNRVKHGFAGFGGKHVHVIGLHPQITGGNDEIDPPGALGDLPIHQPVGAHPLGQIDGLAADGAKIGLPLPGGHRNDRFLLVGAHGRKGNAGALGGTRKITVIQPQDPTAKLGMGIDIPVGVARGEALIVQKPDPHAVLTGVFQHEREILPPGILAELLVGAAFDAKFGHAALADGVHFLPQGLVVLPVLPEKGKDRARIGQTGCIAFLKQFIHNRPSFFTSAALQIHRADSSQRPAQHRRRQIGQAACGQVPRA